MIDPASPCTERSASIRSGMPLAVFVALACYLAMRAIAAPENHDEAQYVAAAMLSGRLLIFRDFLSLQTPLHPWLYSLVAAPFPGYAFIAMRLFTAATAVATLGIVHLALHRIGMSRTIALVTTLALATCSAFQFSAALVRNDMLPTLLMTAGLLTMIDPARERFGGELAAGLLMALAVSAKISFGPAALAPILCYALRSSDHRAGSLRRYGAGFAIGLVPMAVPFALAPRAFLDGVFGLAATIPFGWYRDNGMGGSLGLGAKVVSCAKIVCGNPSLLAIALLPIAWRRRDAATDLLFVVAAGGLIGFLAPTPTHVQYVLPLLPPLFLLMGRGLERVARTRPRLVPLIAVCLTALAITGSYRSIRSLVSAGDDGLAAVQLTETAHEIGAIVREDDRAGMIATLSPDRAADAGLPLDPRFATGPFVYRSGDMLVAQRALALHVTTPATLAHDFALRPPAAMLTGYAHLSRRVRIDPEASLIRYATQQAWQPVRLSDGIGTVWLRPRRPAAR